MTPKLVPCACCVNRMLTANGSHGRVPSLEAGLYV